jgi:hypothetical protein
MGRISQHGIDELGLRKVIAGQAAHLLVKWNKHMELIGFEIIERIDRSGEASKSFLLRAIG